MNINIPKHIQISPLERLKYRVFHFSFVEGGQQGFRRYAVGKGEHLRVEYGHCYLPYLDIYLDMGHSSEGLSEHSRTFQNIPEYSGIFRNIPEYSGTL